ncbi:MAG: IS4 family transposase [Terriglobia bacterium]|jgi:hypothetical protein
MRFFDFKFSSLFWHPRLDETVYAFDSTTIDLCLSLFPWAQFRRRKSVVKLHTLLDLRGNIPTAVYVTSGRVNDVRLLDQLAWEAGAFYLLDRGYVNYRRLYLITLALAFFITRAERNTRYPRGAWRPVDHSTGLRSDQDIRLTGYKSSRRYPLFLRRIHYYDADKDLRLVFLTNNFQLEALTIAQLYRARPFAFVAQRSPFSAAAFRRAPSPFASRRFLS